MTTQQRTSALTHKYVKACAAGNRRQARVLLRLINVTAGSVFAKDRRQQSAA